MSYAKAAQKANAQHHNAQSTHSAQSSIVTHPEQPSTPHLVQPATTVTHTTSSSSTTVRNTTGEDTRLSYKAAVFEKSEYEKIDIDGIIENHAGPAHVGTLKQLLTDKVITPDKFLEMYDRMMRTDKDAVREFVAIVEKDGKGKVFRAKGIINDMGSRSDKMDKSSNSSVPTTKTELSEADYEKEIEKVKGSMERVKAMGEKGQLQQKDVENRLGQLQEKMNELVGKMMELD